MCGECQPSADHKEDGQTALGGGREATQVRGPPSSVDLLSQSLVVRVGEMNLIQLRLILELFHVL